MREKNGGSLEEHVLNTEKQERGEDDSKLLSINVVVWKSVYRSLVLVNVTLNPTRNGGAIIGI